MPEPPLVITDDAGALAEISRVAAATGVPVDHVTSAASAVRWRRAPLVLLDADEVTAAVAARRTRRDNLVVLARGELDAAQWEGCVELGVRKVLGPDASDGELVRLLADVAELAGADGAGDGEVSGTARGPSGRRASAGRGRLIAAVGACGGAGATVLAAAVARAAARAGRGVLLVDVDPCGPGLEVPLGLEAAGGARWGDIAAPGGRLAADALHRALPAVAAGGGSVSVLGHAVAADRVVDPGLLDAVLDAASRAGDVAVVDLPRTPSPAGDLVVGRADLTVLVAPAQVRGCYGAAAMAGRLGALGAAMGLVVRGPSPAGLGADDLARAAQVPLLAAMRPEPGLDRLLDDGALPGSNRRRPLGRAAAAVLAAAGVKR